MNQGNNFNFGIGESGNDASTYQSYYRHQPNKSNPLLIIIVILIILIILGMLWFSGFFTPLDRQAEYKKLYNRVCSASITYAEDHNKKDKNNPGKIIYLTVGQLASANLVEANLVNYLNNEPIPLSTYIRLEVLPSGTFKCYGFVDKSEDKERPVITLLGESTIHSKVGETVTDPGATALDNKDGDITEKIKRSGNVNINIPGTYRVYYTVSDISGNISKTVVRTYIIGY
ncbi:MAG TPA: DUF5011 domain-containing protein [Mollicutes bacterium]|nr:DUF5011 domain-containing protein [Mollicutes bacterium]